VPELKAVVDDRSSPDWVKTQAMLTLARAHDVSGQRAEATKLYARVAEEHEGDNGRVGGEGGPRHAVSASQAVSRRKHLRAFCRTQLFRSLDMAPPLLNSTPGVEVARNGGGTEYAL
jgi:hypothetical protein